MADSNMTPQAPVVLDLDRLVIVQNGRRYQLRLHESKVRFAIGTAVVHVQPELSLVDLGPVELWDAPATPQDAETIARVAAEAAADPQKHAGHAWE